VTCGRGWAADSAVQVNRTSLVLVTVLALVLMLASGRARAQDAALCSAQANAVEHAMGLPPGLLLAVGRVESGQRDPATGTLLPWPWSVNDEGTDHVFGSAFDAIAYVVAARGRGSRSLDVGCFQVNLQFHPDAFATVDEAFDPAANARFAGQLLVDLHGQTGSWQMAVQLYHSATPWRGEAYRDLVLSRWAETSLAPTAEVSLPLRVPSALTGSALPAVAALGTGAPMPDHPGWRTIVRVEYPTPAGGAMPPRRGRLPRVVVPTGGFGPGNAGH
jgi:hypothetical protein